MGTKLKSRQWHLIVTLTCATDNATCHTRDQTPSIFFSLLQKKKI